MEAYLEIAGVVVGLVYLWLEYRASIYLWIASILMPAIYLFVYYKAGLYADFGINVYYTGAAVYGWLVWRLGAEQHQELPITHLPTQKMLPLGLIGSACFVVIGVLLSQYTDSTVPWLDSFTTALSIIGMWMLARKYVEQWLIWIVVDLVSAGLYLYKDLDFTAALYLLYAVIALFGYKKWKEQILQ